MVYQYGGGVLDYDVDEVGEVREVEEVKEVKEVEDGLRGVDELFGLAMK